MTELRKFINTEYNPHTDVYTDLLMLINRIDDKSNTYWLDQLRELKMDLRKETLESMIKTRDLINDLKINT